jgi:predicted ATPase
MPEQLNNFRLIGIRPHKGCNTVFTKVLTKGRMYKLCDSFEFYNPEKEIASDADKIQYYSKNGSAVPEDLYNIEDLKINISAVVGRNGSGKSTLIELILYSVYKLGTTLKDEVGGTILKPYFEEITSEMNDNSLKMAKYVSKKKALDSILKELEDFRTSPMTTKHKIPELKKKLSEYLKLDFKIDELTNKKNILKRQFLQSRREHEFIHKKFKCSIYFEINQVVWEFNTRTNLYERLEPAESPLIADSAVREIRLLNILEPESYKVLFSFFYTIILNYSHYALNSTSLGLWITTLFHKNDGYKTPAVINPMRTDGIININNENELAKARLLSNLLVEAFYARKLQKKIKLTEKQYVCKVRFRISNSKKTVKKVKLGSISSLDNGEKFIISGPIEMVNLVQEIMPLYFEQSDDFNILSSYRKLPFADDVLNYLVLKIPKVVKKYKEYDSDEKEEDRFSYLRSVLSGLKGDKSHVIFKIERALFYLRKLHDKKGLELWSKFENMNFADFDVFHLLDWMEIKKESDLRLILERIPPSIFDIDFIMDSHSDVVTYSAKEWKNLPRFSSLSSGEQQKIHIINGVVYHLNNIYSIHNSNPMIKRIKYHYVNIIFDEIELYFHPDLQKEFVYDLLQNIKRLSYITKDRKKRIKGLNFIFATHSPFILSDIPVQNILKLEYDEISKASVQLHDGRQTFAANIHDLLANNFFFKDKIFIGRNADDYLKKLIREITDLKKKNERLSIEDSKILQRKALLIGESFFREKLLEMINEQSELSEEERIDLLLSQKRKEIEVLEKEKKKYDK